MIQYSNTATLTRVKVISLTGTSATEASPLLVEH